MRDLDLAYLAELVRRDGDRDLQGFFDITGAKLYSELISLAHRPQDEHRQEWRVPIMTTLSVFRTSHGLKYQARETM